MQDAVFVARSILFKINPADNGIHPGSNCPISVMVERVHPGVLKTFIMGPAIPSFPDGRSPLCDRKDISGLGSLSYGTIFIDKTFNKSSTNFKKQRGAMKRIFLFS
jgi:hypothetical protein